MAKHQKIDTATAQVPAHCHALFGVHISLGCDVLHCHKDGSARLIERKASVHDAAVEAARQNAKFGTVYGPPDKRPQLFKMFRRLADAGQPVVVICEGAAGLGLSKGDAK